MRKTKIKNRFLSGYIKFCPKTNRPVKVLKKWMFPIFGILALIWILFRVIPKPDRAAYPCMKVAFPLASSFILYISGILVSIFAFKKVRTKLLESKYIFAAFMLFVGLFASFIVFVTDRPDVFANKIEIFDFVDPLGANNPIGEAKGVFAGRVVWAHNPDATNKECSPSKYGDGYFLDKNCDQGVVDDMFTKALLELTEAETEQLAWESVFKYFNKNHDKGSVGYTVGEKIFIKINAVHAWTTNKDLSIRDDEDYGNVDTSPQAILALLRQLVDKAGVSQDAIYIGDPYTNIFKHCYEKWSADFPDIHYMSKSNVSDRDQLKRTNSEKIVYSDKGTILDEATDSYFDCIVNADYILSVPAIKGHRWGGVTFFAKNHFGSNTRDGASHLHKGLHRINYTAPLRDGYSKYRVFVDIMGYKHLGGKTLLYFGDLLWGTSYEHDPPVKFQSEPFNNDWSSSLLLSLDPVAISSVALDILQAEFTVENLNVDPPRYNYVQFNGIDDYLHQAASSEWWPEGITYDPENDGTPMPSLGVHEHWNNIKDRKYSRNLGTGEGIELLYIGENLTPVGLSDLSLESTIKIFPNPFVSHVNIQFENADRGLSKIQVHDKKGRLIKSLTIAKTTDLIEQSIDLSELQHGTYIVSIISATKKYSSIIVK